ncbi:MAG: hypothetical protein ABFS46_17115 [Myxococcota bacterium]
MVRAITLLGVLALLAVCSRASESVRTDEVAGPFSWGAASNVTHVRHFWFSGQPDEDALEAARGEGIGIVINLREVHEHGWDEEQAVENLGMRYYSVPVPRKKPFPAAAFAQIEALVKDNENEQILIHCSTANRAAGWFATYLVAEHGMSLDDALAVGRKVGITKDAIAQSVANYLGEPAPVAAASPAAPPVEPLLE